MVKFESDFYDVYAQPGEVCIQTIHLPTNTTQCATTLTEVIDALISARDVAFPDHKEEEDTVPNLRSAFDELIPVLRRAADIMESKRALHHIAELDECLHQIRDQILIWRPVEEKSS